MSACECVCVCVCVCVFVYVSYNITLQHYLDNNVVISFNSSTCYYNLDIYNSLDTLKSSPIIAQC